MFDDFWEDSPLDRMMRVHVTDPGDPTFSRTFDLPQDAPSSWLHSAFNLSMGCDSYDQDSPWHLAPDSDDDPGSGDGDRFSDYGTPRGEETSGISDRYVIRRLGSRRAVVGEPWVTMINNPESPPKSSTGGDWQSRLAPFRADHVQHELELAYGYVPAPAKRASMLGDDIRSGSPLVGLLEVLPASSRLRLRAHLEDAALLQQPRFDNATMASLTVGFRRLVERLGSNGVEQADDGWLDDATLGDLAAELEWQLVTPDVVSPGRRLGDLTRRLGYARRFRGRVIATARGYSIASRSRDVVADLKRELRPPSDGYSHSVSSTLALLAIADGSASDASRLEQVVVLGAEQLGSIERPYAPDRTDMVSHTIDPIMSVLAPLGGVGAYGHFSPAVRRLAHASLF